MVVHREAAAGPRCDAGHLIPKALCAVFANVVVVACSRCTLSHLVSVACHQHPAFQNSRRVVGSGTVKQEHLVQQ